MGACQYQIRAFFLLLAAAFCWSASINSKLSFTKVDRTIDVSSQLVKVSLDISLENGDSVALSDFVLSIDPEHVEHLAYVGATVTFLYFISK